MTSSMLSGEKRWASQRSGITVLGKVAVPKPINLPSQRLENYGLDPNVKIVPMLKLEELNRQTQDVESEPPSESTKSVTGEPLEKDSQSLSLQEGINNADPRSHNNFTQVMDVNAPKQKRLSYRQKHNAPLEKSSTEKLVSTSATELQKHPTDTAANVVASAEDVDNEPVSNTDLSSAQNIMKESSTPQRRKNGRNSRNKQKVEEASSEAALPFGFEKESRITNNAVEGDKPKSSDSERAPHSVHSLGDSQSSEKESSLHTEEFHGRANNQWKSQQSRRAARNPQSHEPRGADSKQNRQGRKGYGSWNQHASTEPTSQGMLDGQSSNSNKMTYKSTGQQEYQKIDTTIVKEQPENDEWDDGWFMPEPPDSDVQLSVPVVKDQREPTRGKRHTMKGHRGGVGNNHEFDHRKTTSEEVKEQSKNDEWGDGWFMPEPPDSAVQPSVPVVKYQKKANRGKRHTMKGHRGGVGNNHEFDHRKTTSGEVEKHHTSQPPVAITIPTDLHATSKESRAVGDRSSSHWQPKSTGTAEKMGIAFSKNGGFSLTSGDFPTQGSEKDITGKNAEPQEHRAHGRPGSSSSEIAAVKERIGDVAAGVYAGSGTADSWRRDNPTCPEDGVRPGVEKWHADPHGPHPFPNAGIPLQHYDAWHAPPVNNHPGGVWYNRGPPGGLPYQSPVAPWGFPMEPIHYYGPQVPGPPPFPPSGAGPRGHPSNNGAMFRPPMADAYVRPGMPMWPGFYPPPVAYEESKHGEDSSLIQKIEDLIQKIEDLSVKAGVSGGRYDPHYVSNREEQKNIIHADMIRIMFPIVSGAVYPEKSRGVNSVSDKADRSHDSVAAAGAVISRRSTHGKLGRNDHRSKGRFDSQEIDAWQKKPAVLDASSAKLAGDLEISNVGVRDHSTGSAEKSVLSQARDEEELAKPIYDSNDNDTQRARMRELAQQRFKQRQEEEEEWTREQKAKALAKLEELNRRRTQGVESSAQKMGADSASAVLSKQEVPRTLEAVNMPPGKSEASGSAAVSDSNVVSPIGQSVSGVQKVTVLSDEPPSESTKSATGEPLEKDSPFLSDEPPSESTKSATGEPLEKDSPFLSRIRETAIRVCKDLLAKIGHVTTDNLQAIAKIIRTSCGSMKVLLELFYKLFKVLNMESALVALCVKRALDVLKIFSGVSLNLAAASAAIDSLAKILASFYPDLFGQPMPKGKSW